MVNEPYIDAHSHIWTPDVKRYPLAEGFAPTEMAPQSFTAEELLKICRPAGVGRVNLIQMSFYAFDNRYMLDMMKKYPERFVGTAIVDPFGPDPGRAMRELLPRAVRAFRIQSVAPYARTETGRREYAKYPPGRWLEAPGYAAMFATAAQTGQALSCLIAPDALAEVDRMCGRFPETAVIIDHLGRVGLNGTIQPNDVEVFCGLARHPRVFVKVGAFYALGSKKPPYLDLGPVIQRVVRAFGPSRCMWESDCPFQVVHGSYGDSIALIRDRLAFLSKDDRDWLLRKTAELLLFKPV